MGKFILYFLASIILVGPVSYGLGLTLDRVFGTDTAGVWFCVGVAWMTFRMYDRQSFQ